MLISSSNSQKLLMIMMMISKEKEVAEEKEDEVATEMENLPARKKKDGARTSCERTSSKLHSLTLRSDAP